MSERRQSTRRRTYLGGRASFEKLATSDSCLVRDLSTGGARVVLSGSTPMPNAFDLTLRESGETRQVQVIWRDGLQLGVATSPLRFQSRPKSRAESVGSRPTATPCCAASRASTRSRNEMGRRLCA